MPTLIVNVHNINRITKVCFSFQFDICVSKLPRLEAHLNQILNVNVNGDRIDGGYSYLNIDPHWDTLDRAGPWSNADLMSIESVRHEFDNNSDLHNFILR